MILPFEYYLENGKTEKQVPDKNRANALMSKAEKRLKYLKEITDETAELVFEDVYEAIREASQSLMMLQGYKPLSHEVVIAFLRDKEKLNAGTIHKLDSYRKLRNKSVYAAEKVSLAKAKESLEFAAVFIKMLRMKFASR